MALQQDFFVGLIWINRLIEGQQLYSYTIQKRLIREILHLNLLIIGQRRYISFIRKAIDGQFKCPKIEREILLLGR